jgi:hypothetical protein
VRLPHAARRLPPDARTAHLLNFPISEFASIWIGVGASTVQDPVLRRDESTPLARARAAGEPGLG